MATMTVSYLTVEGEILSETRSGTESDYIPDPLGSTADLLNSSQTITDTFTWWPYGEMRSHVVGSSTSPFGLIGSLGYYTDGISGRTYIRANVLRPALTRWQMKDGAWPTQAGYAYASSSPIAYADPSGYGPISVDSSSFPHDRAQAALNDLCGIIGRIQGGDKSILPAVYRCMAGTDCPVMDMNMITCMSKVCRSQDGITVKIASNSDSECGSGEGGGADCGYSRNGVIYLCIDQCGTSDCDHFQLGAGYHMVLIHELLHLCNVGHPPGLKPECRCNNILACCLLKAAGQLPKKTRCRIAPPGRCL